MALPGQFVIFLAKCIHGSHPNIRAAKRVGLATRYVSPSVRIYEHINLLGGRILPDPARPAAEGRS